MAEIVINDTRYARGKLSITRQADIKSNPTKIVVSGVLSIHRYFEEITQLETRRYILKGVNVYEEDYGSDDHSIIYKFIADELIVKGIDENCESLFTYEEVNKLEKELYPEEDINKINEVVNKEGEEDGREWSNERSEWS